MKKNKRKIITTILIILCSIGLIYSSYNIIIWFIDSSKTKNVIKDIQNNIVIDEVNSNEGTIIDIEDPIDKNSPYWSYIKMNLIDVDFKLLKKSNSDTVGWIQLPGTNINYPFVQTSNNDYYLNHSFNKNYNNSGWIFLDYRNSTDMQNRNNILYAHGRYDGTMFGSLKRTLSKYWQNNLDNHVVKISTETTNTIWQVFSVYVIPTTSDYIQTIFSDDNEYLNFINILKSRSVYDFGVDLTASDKIITLSTCYNSDDKLVLHARLIKIQEK